MKSMSFHCQAFFIIYFISPSLISFLAWAIFHFFPEVYFIPSLVIFHYFSGDISLFAWGLFHFFLGIFVWFWWDQNTIHVTFYLPSFRYLLHNEFILWPQMQTNINIKGQGTLGPGNSKHFLYISLLLK